MLNKRNKIELRKDEDFFNNAAKMSCGGTLLYHLPNTDHFRSSVVIAKKTASQASKRNKLKRYTYQVIEELLPQIETWQVSLVIVIVNPDKISPKHLFQEELMHCISEIHHQYEKNSN